MAQLFIRGVPDFTQVRAEITKLQQEVANISSKPVRLNGTLESDLKGAAVAAQNAGDKLQKVTTITDRLRGTIENINKYKTALGETREIITKTVDATGEVIKAQEKLTTNYEKQAAAARKAALEDEKAQRAAEKYLLKQEQLAAKKASIYTPTRLQQQIESLTGVAGLKGKSAEKSAEQFLKSDLLNSDKISRKIKEATAETKKFGNSVFDVYKKMLLWQVMGTIVSKTIGIFRDALNTMKAVDDELVTVRKVTGATAEELEKLREQAYKTASAYGEAADEYLSSVSAFARAGYGDQAAQLAELATKTKLVGDTTAETAQQFLLSVDAAYKYNGNIKDLAAVLDGANEIDNKYATSIEKIAEGLGTVAPVAAQAHVGIDELTAAIGTITAVTQRSGSEAARAFRALVLNIVGDTKTEIDEGVTWTTGEIAGLKDIIKTYSKEAYEAAEATGSVINPMEAIAGLSQSMKDGLLTEQKLMETVSDIGGKLRTSQLLALIQNWDMYQSMLSDYANAVGSADREVENALDSWTRKTQVLSNKWTEFIQGFISADLIKGVLDGLIGLVDFLNSDFGRFAATTFAVAAGISGISTAIAGITKAVAFFNPWYFAIGAVAAALFLAWEGTEDYRKSVRDLTADIDEANEKLTTNKDRLSEIDAIGWANWTPEIKAEKDAIEQENEELKKQIEYLEKIKAQKIDKEGFEVLGYKVSGSAKFSGPYTTQQGGPGGLQRFTESESAYRPVAQAEAQERLNQYSTAYNEILEDTVEYETERVKVTLSAGEAYTYLKSTAENLTLTLNTNNKLTKDQALTYSDLISVFPTYIQYLKDTGQDTKELEKAYADLTEAHSAAANYIKNYVAELIKQQKQTGAAEDAIYDLVKAEILLNSKKLDLSQQIEALMELATAAGGVASSIAMIGSVSLGDVERTISGMLQTGQAKTYEEARKKVMDNIYKSMFAGGDTSTAGSAAIAEEDGGGTGTDAELERLKNIVSLRKSELSLMQERGDDTAAQIAKMREIQAALHAQAEYMRKIGANQADINALSQEHWNITNKIKDLQKALWTELEDAVNKKLQEAADARDRQTDAIDKQIEALKAANEEEEKAADLEDKKADLIEKENTLLEKQKALQDTLNERTTKIFNAKSGQWEWGADPKDVKTAEDAVSSAQKAFDKAQEELVKYEKELALQAEIDELERKKQLVEDTYNTLKDEWEKITDSLQEPSREIGEILGDIAKNGLAEMQDQIGNVNTLLGKLNSYISGALGIDAPGGGSPENGTPGGGYTGAGYSFDWSKAGKGWTEEEMREGFIPSTGGRTAAAIAAVSKTAGALLTAGGLGSALAGAATRAAASAFTSNRTSNDHYGNIYNIAGVQLTKQQAEGMTLADLARDSRNLGIYKN